LSILDPTHTNSILFSMSSELFPFETGKREEDDDDDEDEDEDEEEDEDDEEGSVRLRILERKWHHLSNWRCWSRADRERSTTIK
jgi:hypothetical protein